MIAKLAIFLLWPGGFDAPRLEGALRDSRGTIECICLAADGRQVAAGTSDGAIFIWHAALGWKLAAKAPLQLLDPAEKTKAIKCIAFSGDGQFIAATGGPRNSVAAAWRVADGRLLWRRSDLVHASSAVFVSNGKALAIVELRTLAIHETATGKKLQRVEIDPGLVSYLACSPDGSTVAFAGHGYPFFRLFAADSLAEKVKVSFSGPCSGLGFAPDGNELLLGSWNQPLRSWRRHRDNAITAVTPQIDGWVRTLAISKRLAAITTDKAAAVTVIDLEKGRIVAEVPALQSSMAALGADAGRLFVTHEDHIRVWNIGVSKESKTRKGNP